MARLRLPGALRHQMRVLSRRSRTVLIVLVVVSVGLAIQAAVWWPRTAAAAVGGAELAPGQVNQNSGAFVTSVAIEVPSYHGVEPKFALTYSSTNGNGEFGAGWQLAGESRIQRTSPGRGAPTYTASDVFQLDGEPLVASTVLGGNYASVRQDFRRIVFDSVANTWTVSSKDGVTSTYAATFAPAAGKTLRWMLSSVTDLHGNVVNYAYSCDGVSECYLDTVSYNGTLVTLYREARPDPIRSAAGGVMTRMSYRVMTIDVTVGAGRARVYSLTYGTSVATGQSLLATVQRHSSDSGVTGTGVVYGGSALPATSLAYQASAHTFGATAPWGSWCADVGWGFGTGDFNGDGKTDLWCHDGNAGNTVVAFSNGAGGFSSSAVWGAWCGGGAGFGTGDFNGDGKTDLRCHDGTNGNTSVALSNGAGGFTGRCRF